MIVRAGLGAPGIRRARISAPQTFECPRGMFGQEGVSRPRESSDQGNQLRIPAIPRGHERIADQPTLVAATQSAALGRGSPTRLVKRQNPAQFRSDPAWIRSQALP